MRCCAMSSRAREGKPALSWLVVRWMVGMKAKRSVQCQSCRKSGSIPGRKSSSRIWSEEECCSSAWGRCKCWISSKEVGKPDSAGLEAASCRYFWLFPSAANSAIRFASSRQMRQLQLRAAIMVGSPVSQVVSAAVRRNALFVSLHMLSVHGTAPTVSESIVLKSRDPAAFLSMRARKSGPGAEAYAATPSA
jgi:hypothetical protein